MRLLSGPAGSGKTSLILEECRALLRSGSPSACLLAPTATMAQHIRNQLAREGLVFRNGLVQTLHSFIDPFVPELPEASKPVFYLLVEHAAERIAPPEFAAVSGLPGFFAALARAMEEFASAGCDAARLAANLPDTPLAAAFHAIYREVERELAHRKLTTRARRLQLAAERIALSGVPHVETLWLDGFHALPDPELELIEALNRHARVTLALNPADCSSALETRLAAMGAAAQSLPRRRLNPALVLIEAANIEREVEEIARRILAQASSGRAWRDIGIVVRSAQPYAPILRTALERFSIPARFYFEEPLEDTAAVRFLSRTVDAMLSGWDHAATLAAMRLAPKMLNNSTFDRFDFLTREQLPNRGLDDLRALAADAAHIHALLAEFASISKWRGPAHTPKEWAERFAALRTFFKFSRPEVEPSQAETLACRTQAAALDAFDESLDETARAMPAQPVKVEDFWRALKSALRIEGVRVPDRRRNVVQVMSASEARQWELPVIFICGMVEKQFPQAHRQDAFFPDGARLFLNSRGIRVRTAAEFEREEAALFQSAISRATSLTVLSYPTADGRGEAASASTFLDDLPNLIRETARPARPQRRFDSGVRTSAIIQSPAMLRYLEERTASLSPSGLEFYFQCAFKYFGSRTLKLRRAPYRPDERFDFLLQGVIAHDVLAQWYPEPTQPVERLFDTAFERETEGKRIPENYRTEKLRNTILDDLKAFAAAARFAPHGQATRTEVAFKLALDETTQLSGRIDRIDEEPDGSVNIFDYKYSPAAGTKTKLDDADLVQAPLYALAARETLGLNATGVFYIGLKGGANKYGPKQAGWSSVPVEGSRSIPPNWLEDARTRSLDALARMRAGHIFPKPSDPAKCRYCDFRDICRQTAAAAEEIAESADGSAE